MNTVKEILQDVESKMKKTIEALSKELSSIRTGRASPALVENLVVNAYGGTQRLKVIELAQIAGDIHRLKDFPNVGATEVKSGSVSPAVVQKMGPNGDP